jgi:hypothetical protein
MNTQHRRDLESALAQAIEEKRQMVEELRETEDERDGLGRMLHDESVALQRAENERDALRETARLAERCARAKGRYHQQHAHCDLMEHFGVPCVRPGDEPEMVTCACGDQYPPDSYGAGFMAANSGVCENCDMMRGGDDG